MDGGSCGPPGRPGNVGPGERSGGAEAGGSAAEAAPAPQRLLVGGQSRLFLLQWRVRPRRRVRLGRNRIKPKSGGIRDRTSGLSLMLYELEKPKLRGKNLAWEKS